ncbi:MAG: EAL domain-containing protein, partial [Alphaproteobacteria bacterium]|nr:EAL domain-containing protein [Alphaproteobacteria bacterium]
MPDLTADTAVTAAGAALWNWRADEDVLVVRAGPAPVLAHLDGSWRLAAFLDRIDGLARSMVAGQLRNGAAGDVVDARMTLSNGCPAHLV